MSSSRARPPSVAALPPMPPTSSACAATARHPKAVDAPVAIAALRLGPLSFESSRPCAGGAGVAARPALARRSRARRRAARRRLQLCRRDGAGGDAAMDRADADAMARRPAWLFLARGSCRDRRGDGGAGGATLDRRLAGALRRVGRPRLAPRRYPRPAPPLAPAHGYARPPPRRSPPPPTAPRPPPA